MTVADKVRQLRINDFYGKILFVRSHKNPAFAMGLLFQNPYYWNSYSVYVSGAYNRSLIARIVNL